MTSSAAAQLCLLAEIPESGVVAVDARVGGETESLLLTRRGAEVAAYLNVCPHAGRRLDWSPGRFMLEGELLICAAHGACFELMSGQCISGPCRGDRLRPVEVRVRGDAVYLSTSD